MKKIFYLISIILITFISNAQVVSTFAGGFSFADGNGISAHFNSPNGLCYDSSGNIYVADKQNNRIRKITSTGVVSTFAGSGIAGSDDGTVTTAQFRNPVGVCADITGNIYVVESYNHKVRKISASGVVSTFAGSDIGGYLDGIGTSARFYFPNGLCSDSSGNIYVADSGNNRIRKITPSGVVTTLAGSGPSGPGGYVDGIGTVAQFNSPLGICSDSSGNIYVADTNNNRIRKITSLGLVSTLAGSGEGNYADGTGTAAKFYFPNGVCSDSFGNIYVADNGNNRIRKITPSGVVTTFAGSTLTSSFEGYADGTGTAAQFRNPVGVCSSSIGNIYVTDTGNNRIRKITSTGLVSTFAGNTISDGVNISSRFNNPYGVCSDSSGNIYVADTQNNRIRKITPLGVVTTFAGSGVGVPGFADGVGTSAQFNSPCGLCSDSFGNIYVADTGNQRIRKITSTGLVSTFAGSGVWGYTDGASTVAQFYSPFGVCSDFLGNIYVVDSGNQVIRKITTSGVVSTFAGSGIMGYADGNGITAQFYGPNGICSDSLGNLYVAEQFNNRIRKITPSGVVSTLAGSGIQGYIDGTLTAAQFTMPHGITVDPSGVIYVIDVDRIRKITPSGEVSTLAGSNVGGYLDGYGTAAQFLRPFGICSNSSGEIFVADSGSNRIRKILICDVTASISYNGNSTFCNNSSTQQVLLTGTGSYIGGIYSSTTGLSIDASTGTINPSASIPGNYTITYTTPSNGGCYASTSGTVTINPLPVVSINNPTVCAGSSTTITALPLPSTGTYSYVWTSPLGENIATSTSSIFTGIAGGYSVVVTDTTTGCSSSRVWGTVTINPLPVVSVNNPTGCAGSSTTITALPLSATGTYSYAWTSPLGENMSANNASISTEVAGTYSVVITDITTGCSSSSASGTVTLYPIITPTFTSIAPICAGDISPILPISSTNTPFEITGTWYPPVISNTSNGAYTFTPGPGQCATITTIQVEVVSCAPNLGNLSITSPSISIGLFDTITVNVQLNNATDVYSLYMKLKGNDAVSQYLDYTGYTAGTLLGGNIISTPPTVSNGVYDFGMTKVGAVPGYAGSGLFYTFTFVPKNNIIIPTGTTFCFYLDDVSAYNAAGIPCGLTNQGQYCYNFTDQVTVWPGDLNKSNTVTTADLLPIGYFYNSTGSTRPNANITWTAQPTTLWGYDHSSNYGDAYKVFADSNGDGVINNADQAAIGHNMNQIHSKMGAPTSSSVPLHFSVQQLASALGTLTVTPNNTIINGAALPQSVTFNVNVNNTGGLDALYGISANLLFDDAIFDFSTATIDYTGSIFGIIDTDCLEKRFISSNMISVGLTRYANVPINGQGLLFKVTIQTKSELPNLALTPITAYVDAANNQAGNTLVIQDAPTTNLTIINNLGIDTINQDEFLLYPNPASDKIYIVMGSNATQTNDLKLKVFNILGQSIEEQPIQNTTTELSTKNWGASGVYFVQITNQNNTMSITKKVIVNRK